MAVLAAVLVPAGCVPRGPEGPPPRDGVARALGRLADAPASSGRPLRFAVLGDYQFMDEPSFERTLADADAAGPDFAVQVGDLVLVTEADGAEEIDRQWAAFARRAARLRAPLLALPGNHDVGGPLTAAAWARVWGPLYYSFDRAGCHFTVLDSDAGARAAAAAKAGAPKTVAERLGRAQMEWLEADLAGAHDAGARGIFVFMHRPLWRERAGWDAIHQLFRTRGVRAVFAGHEHLFRYQARDGIDYVETVASRAGGENFESGRFAHAILAEVDGDRVRLEILHRGKRLPLSAVDPLAQRAWAARWATLPPARLFTAPADYQLELRNPLDRPARIRYSWEAGPDRDPPFRFQPASGEVALAAGESKELDFCVWPTGAETARRRLAGAPRLTLEVVVEAPAGRTARAAPGFELPLQPNFPAVRLPERLPGRVVLFEKPAGAGEPGPLAWLLGQYGLREGRELVVAQGPEDLDRLWGSLRRGDTLVLTRSAMTAHPTLARRLVERSAGLRGFLQSGGRLVAVLGGEEASGPLLKELGLRLVPYDRRWELDRKGDNGVVELAGPAADNPLAEGLLGPRIVYRSVRMLDGWYEAAEPREWRVLAATNVGEGVALARPVGQGLLVVSAARLDAAQHVRENYNQQRVWANILSLRPEDLAKLSAPSR